MSAGCGEQCHADPDLAACRSEALTTHACERLAIAVPPTEIAVPHAQLMMLDRGDHVDAFIGTAAYHITVVGSTVAVSPPETTTLCGDGIAPWQPLVASGGVFGALCTPSNDVDPLTFRIYDPTYTLLHETAVGVGVTRSVAGASSSWSIAWADNGFRANDHVPTATATVDASGQVVLGPVEASSLYQALATSCGFADLGGGYEADHYANQVDFGGGFRTYETTLDDSQLGPGVPWPYDGESIAIFDSGGPPSATDAKPSLAVVDRCTVRHFPLASDVGRTMLATSLGLTFVASTDSPATIAARTIRPDGTTAATITMFEGAPELIVDISTVESQGVLLVAWSMYDPDPERTFVAAVRCDE
jgi:hypothetical protein